MGRFPGVKTAGKLLFETARLRVRRLVAADEASMYSVYGDPIAARWIDDGEPIAREDCARWIEVTLRNYAKYGYGMSAVEWRETGAVIGFVGLVHPGGQKEAEVKYSFLREFWGRGIGTETVQGMVAYGQREHGLREIIATLNPANGASQRVLEKSGLSFREDRKNDDGSTTRVMAWVGS